MAQLVARFHGMEEVGGSNPPSSTEKSDTQIASVGFLLLQGGHWLLVLACSGVVELSWASWLLSAPDVVGAQSVGMGCVDCVSLVVCYGIVLVTFYGHGLIRSSVGDFNYERGCRLVVGQVLVDKSAEI